MYNVLSSQANERLTSGEITQEDFLVLCHQIRQLFQYQEGKHRCNVWDSPAGEKGILKKKPLLSDADLIYHEHKAKLKRTQVQHSFPRLNMLDPEEILDYHLSDVFLPGMECEQTKTKCGGQFAERSRRHSPVGGNRPYSDNSPHDGRRRHEDTNASKGAGNYTCLGWGWVVGSSIYIAGINRLNIFPWATKRALTLERVGSFQIG